MPATGQPFPVIVMAETPGVPPEAGGRFKIWSARRARLKRKHDALARESQFISPILGRHEAWD